MSVQKRISLLITGKVQGVGYRYSVKLKAESMAIRGYVRNQLDGSVFVTVQGENTAVENFVKWCYKGPSAALVRGVEKIPGTIEDFSEFKIL
ncbi:MAG: acylphosphatase [Deltaproteobacteria bacterium]|jgi:acylphosphatase|nr:acylphosphatase [Deltaproteobacteria bacterium]MBT4184387.1 acylphosphatase [Deltaproteobacteria bacterium]MBT4629720.1 acylphosphatase [Deltaproteobacteria bacterium]MBT5086571.1 acylphosphatase [Deltaproteobacteria bacterium]MBT5835141.1 acylphosphatase [Deltaproteobacteria bacterium]